jgi:hypothetical protein
MKQKKAGIIFGAVVFLLMTTTAVMIADGQQNTHIYAIPETSDIEIGDTTNVQLACNTAQPVSIWCIEWLNFTQGVVDCSSVERGTFFEQSQSGDDTYYWELGTIHNDIGVVGGSLLDCSWETVGTNGAQNNVNKTIMSLTFIGTSCGIASMGIAPDEGETSVVGYEGYNDIPYTFQSENIVVHPAGPTAFTATPNGNNIKLSWVKGLGASRTIIRGSLITYPTSITDGTWGIDTAAESVEHAAGPGTYWYYRAWSLNDTVGLYSLTNAIADADPPAEPPATPAPAPAPVQPATIPQNTGNTGGSYVGGASSGAGTTTTRNSTPGFELLVFIGAIGVAFALLRRKR